MSIVFLNGQYLNANEAQISPLDRGFLFADGVYEVIPVYSGHAFRLTQHLERLEKSLQAVHLDDGMDINKWSDVINTLIARNGGGNLSLYLQVSRGAAAVREHSFPDPPVPPTRFVMTQSLAQKTHAQVMNTSGIRTITLPDYRWLRCDIKSVSLLPNILMKQQAAEAGASEAILLRDQHLTEGSTSNVFLVSGGIIRTPEKNPWILGGITRDLVIELAIKHKLVIEECALSEADLRGADEIWMTSSTKEITPVIELDGRPVGNGKPGHAWKRMASLYHDYKLSFQKP